MSLQPIIAANLKALRLARGMTADQLAAAVTDAGANWCQPTVSKIERGSRAVTVDELVALAAALKLTHPWDLTDAPTCAVCNNQPPPGFRCTTCGQAAETKETK